MIFRKLLKDLRLFYSLMILQYAMQKKIVAIVLIAR